MTSKTMNNTALKPLALLLLAAFALHAPLSAAADEKKDGKDAKDAPKAALTVTTTRPSTASAPIKLAANGNVAACLLYTSPSPRDGLLSRMPSSA